MRFKSQRELRLQRELENLAHGLAEARGEANGITERLGVLDDYEAVKKQLVDLQIEKAKILEGHERENREIEHKLGLHKLQVEQERTTAVQEAKLAVREEALEAQKGQFKNEMEFMQNRFEKEVESQRKLVEQVLERLPKFERTYNTVEYVGTKPPDAQLEITQKSD